MTLPTNVLISATAGLVSQHLLSFIEEVPTIGFLGALSAAESLLLVKASSLLSFLSINAAFFGTFLAGTAINRLYFHPLCRFPGKKLAALTKLYEASLNYNGRNSPEVRQLHRRLGDVVRIGPNELSICNVDAVRLLGRQSYNSRGPFYEITKTVGEYSLLTHRENKVHRQWRGIWEQAFKSSALNGYAPRVEQHVDKMMSVIRATEGKEVNVVPLVSNFAFDVMADLGFGKDYGMQDGTGDPTYLAFIYDYMHIVATLSSLRNVCDLLPFLPDDYERKVFKEKGERLLAGRLEMGKTRQDIFTHLLNEDADSGVKFTYKQLEANAQLIIVAGTDTASSTTANIFRELALHPEMQDKLFNEVRDAGELTVDSTKNLPYLQAVVDEGLRLWNPVPSGAQIMTGYEDVTVAGETIPPRTVVRIHHLSLMTDERYFPQGERFWPERWTENREEGVRDVKAYIPFSHGPHVCVGKQLALNELRLSVARTVRNFVLTLAADHDEERYKSEWKDHFTVKLGELKMKFTPRE